MCHEKKKSILSENTDTSPDCWGGFYYSHHTVIQLSTFLYSTDVSCVPSSSGLFYISGCLIQTDSNAYHLPPSSPILINNPKISISIPIFQTQDHHTSLADTEEIQTLSELTSSQVLTLKTNNIASGPNEVSSQLPRSFWLPNSHSARTLLSLTGYTLLLKRPSGRGEWIRNVEVILCLKHLKEGHFVKWKWWQLCYAFYVQLSTITIAASELPVSWKWLSNYIFHSLSFLNIKIAQVSKFSGHSMSPLITFWRSRFQAGGES